MSSFSVENETKIIEIENFLKHNSYLSGNLYPGENDARVMDELEKAGIGTQVHYIPLFLQPYYRNKKLMILPGAMEYYENTLSIPLYTELNKKDIIYISSKINDVINW